MFNPLELISNIDPFWGYVVAFGAAAIGAAAVAYFIPQLRGAMIALVALGAIVLTVFRKGQKTQEALEEQRKASTIKRVQEKYKKIEERKTTQQDVEDRLRKGTF